MTAEGPTGEALATSPNVRDEAEQQLLCELQAELEGLRERISIVETAAELGQTSNHLAKNSRTHRLLPYGVSASMEAPVSVGNSVQPAVDRWQTARMLW